MLDQGLKPSQKPLDASAQEHLDDIKKGQKSYRSLSQKVGRRRIKNRASRFIIDDLEALFFVSIYTHYLFSNSLPNATI